MNGFFNRLRDGLQRLMTGRYGTDGLSRALLIASAVFLVLSLLTRGLFFLILAFACLAYIYFRMFSRNYEARRRENDKYLEVTSKVRKSFRVQKKRFDGRKDYRFFKCPGCGQEVRVPKGKGHIRITCPKCGVQFDRTV